VELTPSVEQQVTAAIGEHPAVRSIRLTGSRAAGRATERSDWDFMVDADDFAAVARDLHELSAPLAPIAEQWDRLSPHWCWTLMLEGPTKIDVAFDEPHELEQPWEPTRESLPGIDRHFWDWALWLRSKEAAGRRELVASELEKLFGHLLGPLGLTTRPDSVAEAVAAYREARAAAERRFGCEVPRELEAAVAPAL
jgi:predicted nucleotidyltransferase